MLKVVITGPESSGKTTLARSLAAHYRVPWVAEYAREYIDQLSRPYQEADLLRIAQEQIRREDAAAQTNPPLLICDTSLLVLRIWSYYRYGRCDPWIEQQFARRPVDHYLLCSPDISWQPDPQRENQHNRLELFEQYEQALSDKRYTLVSGRGNERLGAASRAVDRLLGT